MTLAGLLVLAGLGAPSAGHAHSYKLGDIAIGHIWAPPPEEGAESVPVYGPILNRGDATARLVGVSAPVAEGARFRTEKAGEVRWPDAIDLEPGKPLALAPWRAHVWLSGLARPLEEGDSFPLTLSFEQAGALEIEVVVEPRAGH